MNKPELRKWLKQLRQNLTEQEWTVRNKAMLDHLMALLAELDFKVIHVFLPISNQNEPDLWPLIHELQKQRAEVAIAVSKSNMITKRMTLYRYESESQMAISPLGIPEPHFGEHIDPRTVDVTLIPMLAFDEKGMRLGYGGGFYDRFLALDCRPDVQRIGISLFPPYSHALTVEAHDQPLHACVTPFGVWKFD